MKKLLLLAALCLLCLTSFSQHITYDLLYQEILSKGKISPKGKILSYQSKSGEVFSIGDTLEVGRPSGDKNGYLHIENFLYEKPFLGEGSYIIVDKINIKKLHPGRYTIIFIGKSKLNIVDGSNTYYGNCYVNIESALNSLEILGRGTGVPIKMDKETTSDHLIKAGKDLTTSVIIGLATPVVTIGLALAFPAALPAALIIGATGWGTSIGYVISSGGHLIKAGKAGSPKTGIE
jgi:hypothetical protein